MNINLLIIFSVLFSFSCSNTKNKESSYVVKEYRILLDESSLQKIYNNYSQNTYIPVEVIYKNDTVGAKMRLRGDSSREYDKKSLKIVFEEGKTLQGEKRKINLNSEWTDKSYIRQYISSFLMEKAGVNSFKSSFVALYVNNRYYGLFLQVENMDKAFLADRGLDVKGNLYKATKDGACLSIYDNINKHWEKKSNKKGDWNDLKQLIQELDTISDLNFYKYLQSNFEYDKLISITAMNMLIQNGSTNYHNYYMFHDINGNRKWQMLPWDLDKSMSYYNWEPYIYSVTTNKWLSDNPLLEKMFINKKVKSDLINKLDEFGSSFFNNEYLDPILDSLNNVLEKYIAIDTTDQIRSVKQWEEHLKKEKTFISNQVENIINQLINQPSVFEIYKITDIQSSPPILKWGNSSSSSDKQIKYNIYYSKDYLFENPSTTKVIKSVQDTFYRLPQTLERGKYFWKIVADDEVNKTEGYNRFNFFEYK